MTAVNLSNKPLSLVFDEHPKAVPQFSEGALGTVKKVVSFALALIASFASFVFLPFNGALLTSLALAGILITLTRQDEAPQQGWFQAVRGWFPFIFRNARPERINRMGQGHVVQPVLVVPVGENPRRIRVPNGVQVMPPQFVQPALRPAPVRPIVQPAPQPAARLGGGAVDVRPRVRVGGGHRDTPQQPLVIPQAVVQRAIPAGLPQGQAQPLNLQRQNPEAPQRRVAVGGGHRDVPQQPLVIPQAAVPRAIPAGLPQGQAQPLNLQRQNPEAPQRRVAVGGGHRDLLRPIVRPQPLAIPAALPQSQAQPLNLQRQNPEAPQRRVAVGGGHRDLLQPIVRPQPLAIPAALPQGQAQPRVEPQLPRRHVPVGRR